MADRSRRLGRRTSDAVYGDLSDGGAGWDAGGLRRGPLERVGFVSALWGEPGHVLCLAGPAGERRDGLVLRSFARDALVSASHGGGDRSGGRGAAAAISPSRPAQA